MSEDRTERHQFARLVLVLFIIAAFFVVELVGAKMARSDVLEADAFHLLMDVFALAISLAAMRLAARTPSARFTFGLRRAEPLAALTNGVLVLGLVVELARDAFEHIQHTSMPRSELMLGIATAALVVNGLSAWLLYGAMAHGHGHSHGHAHHGHAHHGHSHHADEHEHDQHARGHQLNLRGAWLHLLGDALGSLAAFIAGLAIRLGAPPVVDPVASFLVITILLVGAVRLLRDAGLVLIEAAPAHLPVPKVEKAILAVAGVTRIERLHVWSLGTGHDVIVAHLCSSSSDPDLPGQVCDALKKRFAIEYVTIQIRRE